MIEENPQKKIFYFTELHLLTDILTETLTKSLNQTFNIIYNQINPEGDICIIEILYQQPINLPEENNQSPLSSSSNSHLIKTSTRLTIIQIQKIIKFHIISKQSINTPNSKPYENQNIDEFWINYKNYLPNKLSQSYLLTDISKEKKEIFIQIIKERIIQNIFKNIENTHQLLLTSSSNIKHQNFIPTYNFEQKNKQLFILAISSNFLLLNRFLTPKEYSNLEASAHQLYQILHKAEKYKITFEKRWGKTGFTIEEKNWIKMYENKMLETKKKRKW